MLMALAAVATSPYVCRMTMASINVAEKLALKQLNWGHITCLAATLSSCPPTKRNSPTPLGHYAVQSPAETADKIFCKLYDIRGPRPQTNGKTHHSTTFDLATLFIPKVVRKARHSQLKITNQQALSHRGVHPDKQKPTVGALIVITRSPMDAYWY